MTTSVSTPPAEAERIELNGGWYFSAVFAAGLRVLYSPAHTDMGIWSDANARAFAAAQRPAAPVDRETSTPAARWRVDGKIDPHGDRYNCERAQLPFGDKTDDELANAVFLFDHSRFDLAAIQRGEPSSAALLTAAKERIRWLSRQLEAAHLSAQPRVAVPEELRRLREALTPSGDTKAAYHGEFKFSITDVDEDGEEHQRNVPVPWDTIKEIMRAIAKHAGATTDAGSAER